MRFLCFIYLVQLKYNLKFPSKIRRKKLKKYKRYILETIQEEGVSYKNLKHLYTRFGIPRKIGLEYLAFRSQQEAHQYRLENTLKLIGLFAILLFLSIVIINIYKKMIDPKMIIESPEIKKLVLYGGLIFV